MSQSADDIREGFSADNKANTEGNSVRLTLDTKVRQEATVLTSSLSTIQEDQTTIPGLGQQLVEVQGNLNVSPRNPVKILLSCHISKDITGNVRGFYHLLDFLKHQNEFLKGKEKDVLITTDHNEQIMETFRRKLQENGFTAVIINSPSEFTKNFSTEQKKAYIVNLNKVYYIQDREDIITTINVSQIYIGIVSVSSDPFLGNLNQVFSIPILSIPEYRGCEAVEGESLTKTTATVELPMNLLGGTQSIFLTNENRENPEEQLVNVLFKEENEALFLALFGKNEAINFKEFSKNQNKKRAIEICASFLQNTLFIPCDFLSRDEGISNFMSIVAESPLSTGYSSIVFLTIQPMDIKILQEAVQNGYLSKKMEKIIIKTRNMTDKKDVDSIEIINKMADPNAKTVTLCNGLCNELSDDYNVLLHTAQIFAGCSHDKSFEQVISNGLIPLFILFWLHRDFLQDACTFNKQFEFLKRIANLNDTLNSSSLCPTFSNVSDLVKCLSDNFNISKEALPPMIQEWMQAIHTGKSFTIDKKTYIPDYNEDQKKEMVDIFMSHLVKSKTWKTKFFKEQASEEEKARIRQEKKQTRMEIEKELMGCIERKGDPRYLADFIVSRKIEKELADMANIIINSLNTKKPCNLTDVDGKEHVFEIQLTDQQEQELMKIFYNKDFPIILQHYLATQISEIARSLNEPFFKQWRELCSRLKKENNLHLTLPLLIDKFFRELLTPSSIMPQFTPHQMLRARQQSIAVVASGSREPSLLSPESPVSP